MKLETKKTLAKTLLVAAMVVALIIVPVVAVVTLGVYAVIFVLGGEMGKGMKLGHKNLLVEVLIALDVCILLETIVLALFFFGLSSAFHGGSSLLSEWMLIGLLFFFALEGVVSGVKYRHDGSDHRFRLTIVYSCLAIIQGICWLVWLINVRLF